MRVALSAELGSLAGGLVVTQHVSEGDFSRCSDRPREKKAESSPRPYSLHAPTTSVQHKHSKMLVFFVIIKSRDFATYTDI